MSDSIIRASKMKKPAFFAIILLLVNLAVLWIKQQISNQIPFNPGHLILLISLGLLTVFFVYDSSIKKKVYSCILFCVGLFLSLYLKKFFSEASVLTAWITTSMLQYISDAALVISSIVLLLCFIVWTINFNKWLTINFIKSTKKNPMLTVVDRLSWFLKVFFVVGFFITQAGIFLWGLNKFFPTGNTFLHSIIHEFFDLPFMSNRIVKILLIVFTNPMHLCILIFLLFLVIVFATKNFMPFAKFHKRLKHKIELIKVKRKIY